MFQKPLPTKKTFLLIHGAWHANWCWKKIIPLLQAQGHKVLTPNLPGHGDNQTPNTDINLKTYVNATQKILKNCEGQVILVGHSMAGVIISELAELMPEKIEKLIYVSAYIPENKKSIFDEVKQSKSSTLSDGFELDKPNNLLGLKKESCVEQAFYNQCSPADAKHAMNILQKQPLKPLQDRIAISETHFGKVPKLYVSCSKDQAIFPEDQARMYGRVNADVVNIDTDHSPFLSNPELLVHTMLQALKKEPRSNLRSKL